MRLENSIVVTNLNHDKSWLRANIEETLKAEDTEKSDGPNRSAESVSSSSFVSPSVIK